MNLFDNEQEEESEVVQDLIRYDGHRNDQGETRNIIDQQPNLN